MTSPTAPYWPRHLPRSLTLPRTSLMQNLEFSALRYPDKVALSFYGQDTTYAELFDASKRLATHLKAQGVQRGDRVLVWMQNCPQWAVAAHAAWVLGAVVVPLAPMLQARELAFFVQDAGIRVGVLGAELYERAVQAGLGHAVVANLGVANLGAGMEGSALPAELNVTPELRPGDVTLEQALQHEPAELVSLSPEDLAVLPYTSGTTGLPKGCMHTHRSVQANVQGAGVWISLNSEDVSLATLPFFHVTGFVNSLIGPLAAGSRVVVMTRWDRDLAQHLMRQHAVTVWTNTATMVIDLMANPAFDPANLATIRSITGGGASLPAAVGQRLHEQTGTQFMEGYGLTETMAQSHTNPVGRSKLQCLGIPLFNVDARVIDLEGGEEALPGVVGEIVMSGPQVMTGYWNRPDENAQAFFERSGVRYFRSGDLGYVDTEGYFFFTDRLKRMINVSGLKVWPAEVESVLHGHSAIQEACVISVLDERSGERARALVVLRPGAQASAQDIESWARTQMAAYKVPRDYQFVESLPRGPTGKVAWRPLQEAARAE
ncbi:long-chain-fatty-acid--CoA ligase [Deinococcus sp.]|uniref:long-chain-fatty-acid--CoA ligase n=1 Tax=Deinococcus sp. TaxID=47478 RepID=UPI0025EC58D8|nr:long-chain-fatty-acid--CoA ligase [Deinococcus sp.]